MGVVLAGSWEMAFHYVVLIRMGWMIKPDYMPPQLPEVLAHCYFMCELNWMLITPKLRSTSNITHIHNTGSQTALTSNH